MLSSTVQYSKCLLPRSQAFAIPFQPLLHSSYSEEGYSYDQSYWHTQVKIAYIVAQRETERKRDIEKRQIDERERDRDRDRKREIKKVIEKRRGHFEFLQYF